MLTIREATQRCSVYNCHLFVIRSGNNPIYRVQPHNRSRTYTEVYDLDDAVLEAGRMYKRSLQPQPKR